MELLARLRGTITDARPAYPETIQLQLQDADNGEWWLTTEDADYLPSDPDVVRGKTVIDVSLDERIGRLTVSFSDGSDFAIARRLPVYPDYPPYWRLYTPEGLVLSYGPGQAWTLKRGTDPI